MSIESILVAWGLSGTDDHFSYFISLNAILIYIFVAFSIPPSKLLTPKFLQYSLVALIIVCFIQYLNCNIVIDTFEGYTSLRKVDYITWLPTSVRGEYYKGNALRSLFEIGSVLGITIAAFAIFKDRKMLYCILTFFGANMTLMGIYALIQKKLDFPIIYNYFYTISDFYGSFPLSNAAGAFLNIGCAINLALAIVSLRKRVYFLFLSYLASSAICSYSAYMSGSEGARLFCFLFWLSLFLLLFWFAVSRFSSKKIATISMLVAISLLGTVGYSFVASNINKIACKYNKIIEKINESASSRLFMYDLSFEIISEKPFWGSGASSCQYLLTREMINSRDVKQATPALSTYHVHSDPLEYLMEFGIAGVVFIIICTLLWFWDFLKSSPNLESLILFVGALLCLLHSCFDMHLHILSTMIAFSIIAVASVSNSKSKESAGENK